MRGLPGLLPLMREHLLKLLKKMRRLMLLGLTRFRNGSGE
jgi:hypothetical protein